LKRAKALQVNVDNSPRKVKQEYLYAVISDPHWGRVYMGGVAKMYGRGRRHLLGVSVFAVPVNGRCVLRLNVVKTKVGVPT